MWLFQAVEGNTWQGEQTAPSCLQDTIKSVTVCRQISHASGHVYHSINEMPPPLPATGARGHHHLQLLFSNSQHTSQSGNGHDKADLPQVRGSKGPVISYSPTKSWEMAGTVSEPTWAAAQLLSSKTNFQASAKPRICVRFCMTKKKKKT